MEKIPKRFCGKNGSFLLMKPFFSLLPGDWPHLQTVAIFPIKVDGDWQVTGNVMLPVWELYWQNGVVPSL